MFGVLDSFRRFGAADRVGIATVVVRASYVGASTVSQVVYLITYYRTFIPETISYA